MGPCAMLHDAIHPGLGIVRALLLVAEMSEAYRAWRNHPRKELS